MRFLFVAIPILLTACISNRELLQKETILSRDMSSENLNGEYSNYSDTGHLPLYFYDFFKDYNSRVLRKTEDSLQTDSLSVIQLEYNNTDLLTVRVLQSGEMTREMDFKVKRKDDVLFLKRHYFLIPIPFIFYWNDERRMALISDVEGNLHVYGKTSYFGWVLMGGGLEYARKQTFSKITDQ